MKKAKAKALNKRKKKIRRFWDRVKDFFYATKRSIAHLWRGNIRFALYRYNWKIASYNIYSVEVLSLSYQRSGSHWLRFIVEWLTGQPTCGVSSLRDPPLFLNVYPAKSHPLNHVDIKAPFVLYKKHRCKGKLHSHQSCILIIRDHHENILKISRHAVVKGMRWYCDLIMRYNEHEGRKMLIYYEDLLTEPADEIRRIADFFKVDEKRYIAFMERYDYLRSISYQGRYRSWTAPKSGDNLHFASKKFDELQRREREKLYEEVLAGAQYKPVLPYLKRYR